MKKHFDSNSEGPAPAPSLPCDSARLQASAWKDGEAPASQALESHLESCDACRSHVEELSALSARLAPLRGAEPVADLWPGIRARAAVAARAESPWNQRMKRIAAALIGCAGTAALLEAASAMGRDPARAELARHGQWPAALHEESSAALELRAAPEQRLLASIDPREGK